MTIVVCMHNNSLGRVFSVEDDNEGFKLIAELAEAHLGRSLSDEERDDIESNQEYYLEMDADNHYCWALGLVEDYGSSL